MALIYEPAGKAREYSPLALNIYKGCDHGCSYCYVPNIFKRWGNYDHTQVLEKEGFLDELRKEAKKKRGLKDQVLLSFTGDPYCQADVEMKITRTVLEILLENEIPVAILTKGGSRCLRDIDLFNKFNGHIKIGATLTFDNQLQSLEKETGAATPEDRIQALRTLHENGIETWVSFEPVIIPAQTLNLMELTSFIDHCKIGKLNHFGTYEKSIDWTRFLDDSVNLMRKTDQTFYIKDDLFKFKNGTVLRDYEREPDYLNVKPF